MSPFAAQLSTSRFRLAHLSDPHLPYAGAAGSPLAWFGKRALSRLSWARGRRDLQRPEVLAAAVADIRAQRPDHILISGDITNFSLPGEFRAAAVWLATLGERSKVSVIPGNHDALVPLPWDAGLGLWQDWMRGDEAAGAEPFPYLRVRGGVALIGLSSALPTAPTRASGWLGAAQLLRLETLLRRTRAQGLCRVVTLHHPPADHAVPARKALRDRAALRAVFARVGAELVLHGHSRDARFDPLRGPEGLIANLGLPSVSALPNPQDEGARWQLLDIVAQAGGWQIEVSLRALNAARDAFEPAGSYRLEVPQAAARAA